MLILPNKKVVLSVAVLLASLAIFILYVDSQVYYRYHFHLNHSIINLLLNRQMADIFDFSATEMRYFAYLFLGFLLLEILIAYACGYLKTLSP